MSSAQPSRPPGADRRRRVDRALQAVAVDEARERPRPSRPADAVARVAEPEQELLAQLQAVAVVVRAGGRAVGRVERVRVGPLAGVRKRQRARVVVQVDGRLVLVAVLDRVTVGVGDARIELELGLEGVRKQVAVVVLAGAAAGATAAAAIRARARVGRHDHRREPARRELAELAGEHAQLEAGRLGRARALRDEPRDCRRHRHHQLRAARAARLRERAAAVGAAEDHGVLRPGRLEVAAADREQGSDAHAHRGDARDRGRRGLAALLGRGGAGARGQHQHRRGGERQADEDGASHGFSLSAVAVAV